jgi:hypothetical protein
LSPGTRLNPSEIVLVPGDLVNGFEFEKGRRGGHTEEENGRRKHEKGAPESTRVVLEAFAVIRERMKSNLMEASCNSLDSISTNKKWTAASVTRMSAPKSTAGARG